ncbi:unnamed protein product [Brachionus calyciflorus]|uniref:Flap endonuclease GEN n=1 Tax=Brachionus calyciflorus TaxID=104777 RepID=A0A813PE48_9BILA|nr:unnamed protein product [Brachionus calyciflorus]
MGVLNLWKIVSPCCNNIDLNELRNKTLAVDLSIWICENSIQSKSYNQTNTKPYLRALFFRCKYLLELNCKLIFVREGDVIDLKQDTMKKRNQMRFGGDNFSQSQPTTSSSQKPIQKRSRYDSVANECCELLKYLGITVIRSPCGEAEKACAYLNMIGRCDGVITEDSDVFLYGARTVYKNFSLDNKSALTIEEYKMDDIETQLGYNRESLIALGLFLGCDYDPKGIPGVGKEMACKFLNELKEQNETRVLDRLRNWSRNDLVSSSQATKYEDKIKKLIFNNGSNFPNEKIIQEFLEFSKMSEILLSKDKYLSIKWMRPCLMEIEIFNDVKQAWPYEYTCEKVIPLIIMYEYMDRSKISLRPIKINKKRKKSFIEYYEVIWSKMDQSIDRDLSDLKEYVTLEKMELFEKFHKDLVEEFNREIEGKKTKRSKKKKKEEKNQEDEFDDEMANSLIEMYENNGLDETVVRVVEVKEKSPVKKMTPKKVKKISKKDENKENYKIIVLDTDSECEEIEVKNSQVQEDDLDLNLLLKSFENINLKSAKKCEEKEKMPKKLTAEKCREKGPKKEDNLKKFEIDDDDIIEIPFSQRMKNLCKNSQINFQK